MEAERSIMEKYGNHMQDMRNRRPEECMQFSDLIAGKIMEFTMMEYAAVRQISEMGIRMGEFKPLNPNLLTMMIKSEVKTFLVCSTSFPMPFEVPEGMRDAMCAENYAADEFLEILLHGILR